MNVPEAQLEVHQVIRDVLLSYVPDEEMNDDMYDAYSDVAETIIEALSLEVVNVDDGQITARISFAF